MELFQRAKTVRLRSKHDKFLVAEEDEEGVAQERGGAGTTARRARWTVEPVEGAANVIRLRGFYGRYLTASHEPFPLAGKKVTQTLPTAYLQDPALEWEPVREGVQVKLRTRDGKYLRANGGLPPWRNSITHDVPHRTATQDWVLWDVEIVEVLPKPASAGPSATAAHEQPSTSPPTSSSSSSSLPKSVGDNSRSTSFSDSQGTFSRLESLSSFSGPARRVDGRTIFYTIAKGDGAVDDSIQWRHLVFNGTSVPELTEVLKKKTQLDDIIICLRSPLNKQQLLPITLRLPPSNAAMRLVVMDANSRAGERF